MIHSQRPPRREEIGRVLDREAAIAFVGRDARFLNELLVAFGDYRLGVVQRIEDAVREENAAELREAAHQLTGALGNFHALAAVTTTRKLEEAGRQERLQNAELLLETLNQELDVLCEAVGMLLRDLQDIH